MTRAAAHAKLNIALVVGPLRPEGKHEVLTVLQRTGLADTVEVEPAPRASVEGFPDDTIVRGALEALASEVGGGHAWRARIEKRIPVAAGLAGGSSDAAAALRLANATLPEPLPDAALARLAARIGADVPFFLRPGPQFGSGDGTDLVPVDLPRGLTAVVLLPHGARKPSTAAVYRAFDERRGAEGWEARAAALRDALDRIRRPADLALLPPNDLASSPLAAELRAHGAVRADVTGAGPAVYGLFEERSSAERAASALEPAGRVWVCDLPWYG